MSFSVLIVDDDRSFSSIAAAALKREGFPTQLAHSLYEARNAATKSAPDAVILDRRLPDGDGLDFLPELRGLLPSAVVIMVTAHADIASAVDAIRAGAADYVVKPIELADVVMKVRRSAEEVRLKERLEQVEAELSERHRFLPPQSQSMSQVVTMVERIALAPRSPVLLLGETGVGKEVLARHLHVLSSGKQAPFIHVNCAALPESTVESELFGHERGAFTDAKTARRGLVEVASGGSLFLDEIGELPLLLQAKLLTFLDSGRFRRLGGTSEQTSTARIVAATNRDLQAEVTAGRFREDLIFRLSVFRIKVPPLRDRKDDIVPLAEAIFQGLKAELGKREYSLSSEAKQRLLSYRFPGNVRELRNLLERALVLEAGPELSLELLTGAPGEAGAASHPDDFHVGQVMTIEELERRYVRFALERFGGRRMEAARALGLSYPTFLRRLEEGSREP